MGDSDLIKYPTKFSNKIIFQSAFKSRTFLLHKYFYQRVTYRVT